MLGHGLVEEFSQPRQHKAAVAPRRAPTDLAGIDAHRDHTQRRQLLQGRQT